MQPGLVSVPQNDFRAGMVPAAARHLIPSQGVYDCQNGLYDEDGSIYRRGGSEYKSNAAFGASLRWIWDGSFKVGQRTVFASPTAVGVLDADDATPLSLGGTGLAEPKSAVLVGGMLFFGGGQIYAGSRKAADYSTGTVAATFGSKVITGTGTLWSANVDAGMLLRIGGTSRYYVVQSVDSNTQLTMTEAFVGSTVSGQAYALTRLGVSTSHGTLPTGEIFATVAGRLVVCSGSEVRFSEGVDPGAGGAAPLVGNFRTWSFPTTNVHSLPGGASVIAAAGVGDRLLVFTTAGLFVISNMALDIIDDFGNPQQRVDRQSEELIAWGAPGVAPWQNATIIAGVDGVYAVDGISEPKKLSRSITPAYLAHVRGGDKPGQPVVYNSHLFLPVLDSSNAASDLLVCRLDRPVSAEQGTVYPWSSQRGHGGNVVAVTLRAQPGAQRLPELLGAGRSSDARIVKLGKFFEPGPTVKNDADGTTHVFQLDTRDYASGVRNRNVTRFVRVLYELTDAGTDRPTITVLVGKGTLTPGLPLWNQVNWNAVNWPDPTLAEMRSVQGNLPATAGRWRRALLVNQYSEFTRYRLISSGPSSKLVIREIESLVLPSGKSA